MNRFTSMILSAAFLFAAGSAHAQNLTGSWKTSNGVEGTVVHNGSEIRSSEWAGDIRGTSKLTGGPRVFTGTWQNQKPGNPGWNGSGTLKITIINANTFTRTWEGTTTHRGVKYPVSGTETWYRQGVPNSGLTHFADQKGKIIHFADQKGTLIPFDVTGTWLHSRGQGQYTFRVQRLHDGTYSILGNPEKNPTSYRATVTRNGNIVTFYWRSVDGRLEGYSRYAMSADGKTGTGTVTYTKTPNSNQPKVYSSTIRRM